MLGKRFTYPLVLILISVLIHHVWITNFSPLAGGDWIYYTKESLADYFRAPVIWVNSYLTTGSLDVAASYFPVYFLMGFLSTALHLPYSIIERLIFMWPLIVLIPLGSYYFILYVLKSRHAAFIGSLVFSYNTFTLTRNTDHLLITMAFSLTPLVMLYFMKALDGKKYTHSIISGFLLLISSYFDFRIAYVIEIMLLLYIGYFSLVIERDYVRKHWKNILLLSVIPPMILLVGNIFWLIAVFQSGNLTSNVIFNRGIFGNEFLNILYSLTLYHPFWTGAKPVAFVVQPIALFSFLLPVLAFSGLYMMRDNARIIFFGILSLLGVFLVKQGGIPFSNAYQWLYDHFPGFNAFREATKFYFIIVLGYSVLIAAFITGVTDRRKKSAVMIATALLLLTNTIPLINGRVGTLFVPRSMPGDYVTLNDYLNKQPGYFRTLWVPMASHWSTFSSDHPTLSFDTTWQTTWKSFSGHTGLEEYHVPGKLMIDAFQKPEFGHILDMSSVKYVVVALNDTENDDAFMGNYGLPREEYIKNLSGVVYLSRVRIPFREVALFENKNIKPKIYSDQPITFRMINPTHYSIYVNKNVKPIHIQFSESYDSHWQLRSGNTPLPDKYHTENEAGFNTFVVDSSDKPRTLDLVYTPQSSVVYGSLFTVIGLLSFIALFSYGTFIQTHEKKRGPKK